MYTLCDPAEEKISVCLKHRSVGRPPPLLLLSLTGLDEQMWEYVHTWKPWHHEECRQEREVHRERTHRATRAFCLTLLTSTHSVYTRPHTNYRDHKSKYNSTKSGMDPKTDQSPHNDIKNKPGWPVTIIISAQGKMETVNYGSLLHSY